MCESVCVCVCETEWSQKMLYVDALICFFFFGQLLFSFFFVFDFHLDLDAIENVL